MEMARGWHRDFNRNFEWGSEVDKLESRIKELEAELREAKKDYKNNPPL